MAKKKAISDADRMAMEAQYLDGASISAIAGGLGLSDESCGRHLKAIRQLWSDVELWILESLDCHDRVEIALRDCPPKAATRLSIRQRMELLVEA